MSGEPDNLVLSLLREIRGDVKGLRDQVGTLTERTDTVETKLDGLTHAVIAGFGSLVHEIDDVKKRLDRLEGERV